MLLLHLLPLKGWYEFPISSLVRIAGSIIQGDKCLFNILLIQLTFCENNMSLKALGTQLQTHSCYFMCILMQFHCKKCLGLLLQKRYEIRVVLNLARKQYYSIACSIYSYIAVANVGDDSGILGCQGQQELEALVYQTIRNHVLHNFVDHQVDALRSCIF